MSESQSQCGSGCSSGQEFSLRRPILIHINADTTWVLSLPHTNHGTWRTRRSRLNILIDPWLRGPQTDVAGWFSTQWHQIASCVQTIDELNDFLREKECLELQVMEESPSTGGHDTMSATSTCKNYVDAVVCSHEFTDHCHEKTLKDIHPSTPCLATTKAAELIRSWKHFEQVFEIPHFGVGSDWRQTRTSALPPWIGISRLVTESDTLHLHAAIAIIFSNNDSYHTDSAEAVVYTPHGIRAEDLAGIPAADPPIQALALMHGLHNVWIPFTKQLNLGAPNALKCQRVLKSKYWVGTHDEVKIAQGIVAHLLKRKSYTPEDQLKARRREDEAALSLDDKSSCVELGSGQSLVLT